MTTTPTSLLTIQGVTAFHLLGNSTLPLTAFPSPLCLLSSSSSSTSSSSTLTLSLGSLAFPLVPGSTVFGTQEGNPAGFFLKPHIEPSKGEGEELPPSGWIKLQFPAEAVDGGQSSLSSRFEEILVKHGFLQEGVSAEEVKSLAKELSEGIKEGGHTVKEGIEQTAEQLVPRQTLVFRKRLKLSSQPSSPDTKRPTPPLHLLHTSPPAPTPPLPLPPQAQRPPPPTSLLPRTSYWDTPTRLEQR